VAKAHGVPLSGGGADRQQPLRERDSPVVLGRKGWLFSDSVHGAVASANLFSLVETAKANGVEPHAYLARLFDRLSHLKAVEDYEAMLPWNIKPSSSMRHQLSFCADITDS
jgi:hypothetical protein